MNRRNFFRPIRAACAAAFCLALLGCATADLPRVDLSGDGWTVWQGQALWRARAEAPALAGELIAARHRNGDVLVSFAKPPVPIFTARTAGGVWHLDLVHRDRDYSGRGRPPRRFVWFRLPDLLAGGPAPRKWQVQNVAADEWTLENPRTGESIRLILDPVTDP